MRVLIDTNIHISASLSRTGIPYQAYIKAVTGPNEGLVSNQNIDELRRVYNRKFPDKISA
jgi:predicted nucleic acid-binding protein